MNEALVSRAVQLLAPEPGSAGARPVLRPGQFHAAAGPPGRPGGGRGGRRGAGRAGRGQTPPRTAFRTPNSTWRDLMQALARRRFMGEWRVRPYVLLDPPRVGRSRNVADRRTSGAAARGVYFLSSGQSRAGYRHVGSRSWVQACAPQACSTCFPHTTHVESLARAESRRGSSAVA